MSAPNIVNFTIYGERCSGTVFLEEAITKNFNLPVMWYYDWKHFFGMYDFDADNANAPADANALDNTIFIGIVREPVAWLNSFSKSLHHVPECNHSLKDFLEAPFYSVVKDEDQEVVIQEDVNYITKSRFQNIFELRKIKNDFLMNVMQTKVRNYILITYEDLLNNYDNTLDKIKNKFNLVKTSEEYEKIVNHTNGAGLFTGERAIDFSCETIDSIWSKLDVKQENSIGYYKVIAHLEPEQTLVKAQEQAQEQSQAQEQEQEQAQEQTIEFIIQNTTLSRQFEGVSRLNVGPTSNTQYSQVIAPNVTNVIPKFSQMYKNIVTQKKIKKNIIPIKKYKNNTFFKMAK